MDNFESRIEEIHCRLECGDPGLRYCAAKELGFLLINLHTSALEFDIIKTRIEISFRIFLNSSISPNIISGVSVALKTLIVHNDCGKKSNCSVCTDIFSAFICVIRRAVKKNDKLFVIDEILDVWQSGFSQDICSSRLFLIDFCSSWASSYREVLLSDSCTSSSTKWFFLAAVTGEIVKLYAYQSSDVFQLSHLKDIADEIFLAVINYKLVDEERGGHSIAEWFGGYQKEAGVKQKNVKSKLRCLVSAALKSLYIILQIPADTNAENVAKLQSFLTEFNCHTAKDLIDLILEDDEDLNYLLLCCLEINRRVPKSCGDLLNVNYLWMELQINIGWDHSLILDWINSSETEFLLFLVRYLKLLIHTKEDFKTVKLTPWLNNDTGIERGKQLQNGKLLLEVTIHENLAGLNSCKTIKMYVNGEVNRQTSVIKKLNDSGEMAHQKMSKLFGELSGALVKLQSRKLLNFNPGPLVKLLKSYGDISSN